MLSPRSEANREVWEYVQQFNNLPESQLGVAFDQYEYGLIHEAELVAWLWTGNPVRLEAENGN